MFAIISQLISCMLPLGFMTGGTPFPTPLTPDQERECLILAGKGDKSAKEKLVVHNQRLVAHIIKKYSQCPIDTEDLFQIGLIGLIKGIENYDSEKNVRLATFCARCIDNEILMELRKVSRTPNELSLSEAFTTDKDGKELSLLETLECEPLDITEDIERREMEGFLHDSMKKQLTPREHLIVTLRYGLGGKLEQTQNEIASALNISRSYVSRIEKKAIGKLKGCLDINKKPK